MSYEWQDAFEQVKFLLYTCSWQTTSLGHVIMHLKTKSYLPSRKIYSSKTIGWHYISKPGLQSITLNVHYIQCTCTMHLLKSCCESSHENTEDRNCSLACTSSIGLYREVLVTSPSATVSTQWVMLLKNSSIMFNSRLAHAVTQWGPWSPETNCWNELNSLGSSWIDITTDLEKSKRSMFSPSRYTLCSSLEQQLHAL